MSVQICNAASCGSGGGAGLRTKQVRWLFGGLSSQKPCRMDNCYLFAEARCLPCVFKLSEIAQNAFQSFGGGGVGLWTVFLSKVLQSVSALGHTNS